MLRFPCWFSVQATRLPLFAATRFDANGALSTCSNVNGSCAGVRGTCRSMTTATPISIRFIRISSLIDVSNRFRLRLLLHRVHRLYYRLRRLERSAYPQFLRCGIRSRPALLSQVCRKREITFHAKCNGPGQLCSRARSIQLNGVERQLAVANSEISCPARPTRDAGSRRVRFRARFYVPPAKFNFAQLHFPVPGQLLHQFFFAYAPGGQMNLPRG